MTCYANAQTSSSSTIGYSCVRRPGSRRSTCVRDAIDRVAGLQDIGKVPACITPHREALTRGADRTQPVSEVATSAAPPESNLLACSESVRSRLGGTRAGPRLRVERPGQCVFTPHRRTGRVRSSEWLGGFMGCGENRIAVQNSRNRLC